MRTTPHDAPAGFEWITRVTDVHPEPAGVRLAAETHERWPVRMAFRMPIRGIWEWTIVPEGSGAPPATGMLLPFTADPMPVTCVSDDKKVSLAGGGSVLRIDRDPWSFRLEDADGRTVFRENSGDVDGLGRPFVLPFGLVRQDDDAGRITFAFHLEPGEHLFGLGEKFLPLNRHGQRIVSWTQDAFGSTTERSHKNIPFLLSERGYGLFLDTGARIRWDLGVTSCQSCAVAVEANALRLYLIPGRSPAEILHAYAMLTGFAPVPPPWTFGLWVSSGGTYRDRAAIEGLVDGLDRHGIMADVVHIDPWWMTWRRYCDFRWNHDAFPEPEDLIGRLHAKGLRLCLWEHPYISVESELFEEGKSRGYFLRDPEGEVYVIDYGLSLAPRPDGVVRTASAGQSWNARVAIIDLTLPAAVRWFQDLHRPILRLGADIFKTDFGEDIPEDALFANGQTGAAMHNLYPLLYNEAVAEVTRQERGHGAVWGRAATGGSQRTPVCWSGDPAADFDSLACTVRGGLSMGLSGVPFWSNDIGGYRGMPSAELYVRWAQFGLFCSHSRMHGDSPREPWVFGEEALAIVRRYVDLRYQLFPYLYAAAIEAHRTALPVMRALMLQWPGDPRAWDIDQQYMLGPSLMVAPVVHPSGRKTVYLPGGCWVDLHTGQRIRGPVHLALQVPLETLPLYVRAGAVIPMLPAGTRITGGSFHELVLEIHPGPSPCTTLIADDDGETRVTCEPVARGVTVTWDAPVERRYILRIHPDPAAGTGPREGSTALARRGSILIRT